jgi:hypothetical protein
MGTPVRGPELDADESEAPVASWVSLAIVSSATSMSETYSNNARERI